MKVITLFAALVATFATATILDDFKEVPMKIANFVEDHTLTRA